MSNSRKASTSPTYACIGNWSNAVMRVRRESITLLDASIFYCLFRGRRKKLSMRYQSMQLGSWEKCCSRTHNSCKSTLMKDEKAARSSKTSPSKTTNDLYGFLILIIIHSPTRHPSQTYPPTIDRHHQRRPNASWAEPPPGSPPNLPTSFSSYPLIGHITSKQCTFSDEFPYPRQWFSQVLLDKVGYELAQGGRFFTKLAYP